MVAKKATSKPKATEAKEATSEATEADEGTEASEGSEDATEGQEEAKTAEPDEAEKPKRGLSKLKRGTLSKDHPYLIAQTAFLAPNGVLIQKGTAVTADDPVVEGREKLFAAPEDSFRTTRASQ